MVGHLPGFSDHRQAPLHTQQSRQYNLHLQCSSLCRSCAI